MKKGKTDPELLAVINEVKDNSKMTWCQKLDEILKFEKTRGLTGFHISAYPMNDKKYTSEQIAKALIEMMENDAQGNYYVHEEGDAL